MTPQEAGRLGYETTLRRYGRIQMNRWRRMGGRRPNPTLEQIRAGTVPDRKRPVRKYERRGPRPVAPQLDY